MSAMSDRLVMQGNQRVQQMHHNHQQMHRVSTHSHMPWVGVACVGEWRRGEDRGVCAGVGSHSPDFDMSDMVWLYAVGGPQVHLLTYSALHEV